MAASDYAYITTPSKIEPLLDRLTEVGVPQRATQSWLQSIGFTSTNDRPLIAILRQVDFIDASGRPTIRWEEYRAGNKSALADGIRQGYPALFSTFPDAHKRSTLELENVVKSTAPRLGRDAIGRVVSTFKTLVSLANFSNTQPQVIEAAWHSLPAKSVAQPSSGDSNDVSMSKPASEPRIISSPNHPAVTINITINLPPSATSEDYRHLFTAMRSLWSEPPDTNNADSRNDSHGTEAHMEEDR